MTGSRETQTGSYYTPMRQTLVTLSEMTDTEKNLGEAADMDQPGVEYSSPGGAAAGTKERRCKWGPFSPQCCQSFRKPAWMLVCLCWAGAVQGMAVNGFVNVVISTVERRFELSSTESGFIASCYDIAAVVCLIPLTYFGGRGRKPVYLSIGMLILGVGAFLFSIPHFATPLYDVGQAQDSVCTGTNGTFCVAGNEQLSFYRFVFYLGQLLHGAGATPLYTLGTTYLDDNLPVLSTSVYQGIFYAFAILGPGFGYLAGGGMLNIYTDFDSVDVSELDIDRDNPRWVGAWWLGFLFSGILALMISVPLFGFPKSLPGAEEYRAEKEKEVYKGKDKKQEASETQSLSGRHILTSVRFLVTNPTFMFLNLAAATSGIIVSGVSTFSPKYIEFQFSITSGTAAQYVGMVAIPMAGGATFLGGWLIKHFEWNIRQILKFCFVCTAITEGFVLIFLIYCDNMPFAGISTRYGQSGSSGEYLGSLQLDDACNAGCSCSKENYNPVCSRDNIMYYSPCYAGCSTSYTGDGNGKKYSNCSCVAYNYTSEDMAMSELWMVKEGKCDSDCSYLPAFMTVFGIAQIGIFITSMPALSATLRCVTQDERAFALGIQWIIARCLGSIPGPVLFGKIIDMTCLVWKHSCKGNGACFYYDNRSMSYSIMALALSFNFLSILFFLLAFVCYRSMPIEVSQDVTLETENDPTGPSHHTSMTTITEPPTPSTEYPAHQDSVELLTPVNRSASQDSQSPPSNGFASLTLDV